MIAPNGHPEIVVAGLGNLLMADDGVGVHAVWALQEKGVEGAVIAEVGTAALHAQDLFAEAKTVIAIDAVAAGGETGEVYVFDLRDVEVATVNSLHDLGIAGVLRLMAADERPEVIVVGVEPARIEYGMELSAEVEGALSLVLKTVRELVAGKRPVERDIIGKMRD